MDIEAPPVKRVKEHKKDHKKHKKNKHEKKQKVNRTVPGSYDECKDESCDDPIVVNHTTTQYDKSRDFAVFADANGHGKKISQNEADR